MRSFTPRPLARRLTATAVGAFALSVFIAPPPVHAQEDPPAEGVPPGSDVSETATDTEIADAVAEAEATGNEVEIESLGSASSEVYALPGGTFKEDIALEPFQALTADGVWAPIDNSLVAADDGSLVPANNDLGIEFSGGGSTTLVKLTDLHGRSVTYTWQEELPTPTVVGDTATYAEILPGVDLRLRATNTGFAKVFEVKDATAASSAAVASLELGVELDGFNAAVGATGALEISDFEGNVVYGGPTPVMWDSTTGDSGVGDSTDLSWSGSTFSLSASVGAAYADGVLTLTPDAAMLADPAAVFPIRIDPEVVKLDSSAWAMVSDYSSYRNRSYYNGGSFEKDPNGTARLGRAHKADGSMEQTWRLAFEFNTGKFRGKDIIDANLRMTMTYSWMHQCDGISATADIWELDAGNLKNWTWNSQSDDWVQKIASRDEGIGSGCGAPRELWTDVTDYVQDVADSSDKKIQFGLRSSSEDCGSQCPSFRRFGPEKVKDGHTGFYLSVEYNTAPNAPSALTIDGQSCTPGSTVKLGAAESWTATAKLSDDEGDNMSATLTWTNQGSGADWSKAQPGADRTRTTWTVPKSEVTGQEYIATVAAKDGRVTGESAGGCTILVDTTPPAQPTVVSTDYPSDGVTHGSVGQTGRFTVDSTSTDTAGYCWGLQGECEHWVPVTTPGDPATIALDPPTDGDQNLFVRAYDAHDNKSTPKQYVFKVGTASSPVGHWKFDETEGTVAADSDYVFTGDVDRPLTVTGATWTSGDSVDAANGRNRYLSFDGDDQAVSTAPVVATNSSYTVSAWVRINQTDIDYTIASQEGLVNSAFMLKYDGESKTFLMVASNQDSNTSGLRAVSAGSNVTARAGVWYNVTGVFSYGDQQLRLYVNGQLENTAPFSDEWNATHAFAVGRDLWAGNQTTNFAGDIDDVRVWNRVVSTGEIQRNGQHAEALYDFETYNDDRIPDSSGADRTLTGHELGLVEGFQGTAGEFNGTTSTAYTSGQVMNTAGDFTIGAWVRLDRDDVTVNALSQDGTHVSPFYLGYVQGSVNPETGIQEEGRWAFRATGVDASSSFGWTELYAPVEVSTGDWTHLAVVYETVTDSNNVTSKVATLYVNGVPVTAPKAFNIWSSTGPLRIGAAKHADAVKNYWPGAIDNVSINTGAFDDQQVAAMADRTVRENHSELVTGDFNGDQLQDALVVVENENGDSAVQMLKGNGESGFALMTGTDGVPLTVLRSDTLPQRDGSRDWRLQDAEWRVGDLNGDSIDDLVIAVPGEDVFSVWGLTSCNPRTDQTCTQDASPFKPSNSAPYRFTRDAGWELTDTEIRVGDVSGDLRDDLVLLRGDGTSAYSIWSSSLNTTGRKPVFKAPAQIASGTGDPRLIDFTVADFNGDWRGDIVEIRTGSDGSADLYARYGSETGLGAPELKLDTPNNWDTERDNVVVADVTGDGLPDLVNSYRFPTRVRLQVAAALPGGGFDTNKSWGYSAQCTGCATDLTSWVQTDIQAADIDKDGDADLVSLRAGEGGDIGALWTRHSSGGAFAAAPTPRWATEATCFGAEGDVNGDGYRDTVLPYSAYAAEGLTNAGAIWFIDGATGSVSIVTEETYGSVGTSETGDLFGYSVGVYDADGDGCSEIAIGVPGEGSSAGSVIVLPGASGGVDEEAAYWFSQSTRGIPGASESNDRFGYSIAATNRTDGTPVLIVGIPGEDVQTDTSGAYRDGDTQIPEVVDGGAMVYIQGDTKTWLTQNSWGSTVSVEAGDQFGFALAATPAKVVVGNPYEDTGATNNGGIMMLTHDVNAGGIPNYTNWIDQASSYLGGAVEAGDQFGRTVAAVDYWYSGATPDTVRTKVAIGVPFEDLGTVVDAGMVSLIEGDSTNTFTSTLDFVQGGAFGDQPSAGDNLGTWVGLFNLAPHKYGSNSTVKLAVSGNAEDYVADGDGIVHVAGAITFDGGTTARCDTVLYAPAGVSGGAFGTRFAATPSRLYITEPGRAALYRFNWSSATVGTDQAATVMAS